MSARRYYRPYDSESESESECSTSSWSETDPDTAPNFRAFASQLQLIKTGGPTFSTMTQQLEFQRPSFPNTPYSDYSKAFESMNPTAAPPPKKKEGFDGSSDTEEEGFADVKLNQYSSLALPVIQEPPKSKEKVQSIILLNSRDRDRQLYPQPTTLKLKLPRVYQNVTNFQLTQLSLLTSFYYFRPDKENLDISIQEQDRTTLDKFGNVIPLVIKNNIRQGSYNIQSLLTEITKWINNVPIFFDFINGFADFQASFQSSGDFGVNFNEAGDWFFDTVQNDFIQNPTKDLIISKYWKNRLSSQNIFTTDEVRVAYYYPVIKEALLDTDFKNQIDLTYGLGIDPTITTTHQVMDRIIYTFTGIDDPVALAVINGNSTFLDSYRLKHTFRNYLVNKYTPILEAQSQQVIFQTTSLNTSLVNLLNQKQAQYLAEQLALNGITSNDYAQRQSAVNKIRAVIQEMNSFQQSNLATYFAIPFNTYRIDYFANLSNTIAIRNGIGAVGIPKGYSDPSYNPYNPIPIIEDITAPMNQEPPTLWPQMTTLANTIDYFKVNTDVNRPYMITRSNIDTKRFAINPSTNQFIPNLRAKDVNVLTHISASHYTVFSFTSPVRQTMQVETLYRPQEYRVPAYNSIKYSSTIAKYFDASYAFVPSPYTAPAPYKYYYDTIEDSAIQDISGWSTGVATFGVPYSTAFSYISSPTGLSINTYNKSLYFRFTTPDSNSYDTTTSTIRYSFNVDTLNYDASDNLVPPKQPMRILFYKDRSAFMGDVYQQRNEFPTSAWISTILDSTSTSVTTPFTVYPNQTFYVTVRPDPISFGAARLKVIPYFPSSFEVETIQKGLDGINPGLDSQYNPSSLLNYNLATIYDSNYLSLPIRSTLWFPDPTLDPNQTPILTSNTPIGYDLSGVSNNFTDYMPFIVNKSTNFTPYNVSVGIDPINEYQFQSNSPYNVNAASYFYPGSQNAILVKKLQDVYSTMATVPYRQENIVHYYSLNYLLSGFDVDTYSTSIRTTPVQQPVTQFTTGGFPIRGYEYAKNTAGNTSNAAYLSLGQGPCGFSFIPYEGIWDIDKIVLRSAFTKQSNDPNQLIRYLGVYNTADIFEQQTQYVNLFSSILVLSNTSNRTYDPSNPFSLSAGFDANGGTYYEFKKLQGVQLGNRNSTISGYVQDQGTMTSDTENLYSIIAFDSNYKPTTIKALSGSMVPFPYYSQPKVSTCYLDQTKPPLSEFYDVVVPFGSNQPYFPLPGGTFSNYAPPTGYDGTQSFYLQSQPIGTSVTHYIETKPLVLDVSGIYQYDLPFQANNLVATVKDYLLTQTSVFQIWYYEQVRRYVTLAWSFTGDSIFPADEGTSLLGVSGNTNFFVFMGAKSNSPTTNQLRFKTFNPTTGVVEELFYPTTFSVQNDFILNSFTFTNSNAFTFAGQTSSNIAKLYRCLDGSNLLQYSLTGQPGVNIQHTQDASSNILYWLKQDASYNGSTFFQLKETDTFPGREFSIVPQAGKQLPSTFRTMAMSLFRGQEYETVIDEILFTSAQTNYRGNFYSVYSLDCNASTATVLQSVQPFSNLDVSGAPIQNAQFVTSGFNSSRWFMTDSYPYLWANRNNPVDVVARIDSGWQIFYPWQKIVMRKIANNVNPITDLTGLGEPEYPHTAMFYYRNYSTMINDIGNQWGLERSTNFEVANVNFGGFAFNSYIFDVPLRASSNTSDLQYLAIRNGYPTEESQVMTRFVVKNRYSFGYLTFSNLAEEANLYKAGSNRSLFDPIYANVLVQFDTAFSTTKYWGSNLIPGFTGCNLTFSNYGQFISTYSNYYKIYQSNADYINGITSTVRGNLNNYISTQLANILPPSALKRQNATDPLQFSIYWKTALKPNYVVLKENWGLGYNLGFAKQDTPYGTVQRAESFYKIIDDYIYLRMNPEYDMNRLDFGGREDKSVTLDPTGSTKTYYGKLLLNNFNAFSQTFVQNAVAFNPPLGRIDQLSFEWVSFAGDVIDNADCEWSASVQIQEEVGKYEKPPQITTA